MNSKVAPIGDLLNRRSRKTIRRDVVEPDLDPWRDIPPPDDSDAPDEILSSENIDEGFRHPSPQPHRLTLKRLLDGNPPPPPSLQTENFILAADITFLGGNGDSGKTTTMVTASVCTPIARPVFGTLAIKRPGPVVFIVPEDGEAVIRHHVEAVMAGMELTDVEEATLIRDLHIVGDDRRFNLLTDTPALATLITDIRPSLVIADPLTSLIGGAEESDEKVADLACYNLRRDIARPFGAAILLAGHLRKPSRETGASTVADVFDLKGSVGWSNHARMVWTVSKPKGGNLITFRLVKSNRIPTGIEHQVSLSIDAAPENPAHWLSCRLIDANIGATKYGASESLTPGVGRALNANETAALTCLDDRHEPGRRLSWSRWRDDAGINPNTFRTVKTRLLDAGLASAMPTGRRTNNGTPEYTYGLTDWGREALATGRVSHRLNGEG